MKINFTKINTTKNLLAFSGGVDSSALFHLLLENKTPFDFAIVNYNLRQEAKKEIEYAKELAKKYNKKLFIKDVKFESSSNFEKKARDIRYDFFKELVEKNFYEVLITAHQLNDKLEWFLMQLSRGAGLAELLSFEEFSKKENYKVFKPLINISRDEIENYLKQNNIKYFLDKTNSDTTYTRNYFRKEFSNKFIKEFKKGVINSFKYLEEDLNSLDIKTTPICKIKELTVYETNKDDNLNIRTIDLDLKKRAYLLSKAQRDEILKQKQCVISNKIAISISKKYIFICSYEKEVMPKKFKEKCRLKNIPKNIRSYIYKNDIMKNLEDKISF